MKKRNALKRDILPLLAVPSRGMSTCTKSVRAQNTANERPLCASQRVRGMLLPVSLFKPSDTPVSMPESMAAFWFLEGGGFAASRKTCLVCGSPSSCREANCVVLLSEVFQTSRRNAVLKRGQMPVYREREAVP